MQNNICSIVFEQAKRKPGALALVGTDKWLAYTDLAHQIGVTAAYLASMGVGTGDKVISGLRSGPRELIALLALAHLGALSIPLNPGWSNSRRAKVAREVPADWLLLEREEGSLAQSKPDTLMLPPKLHEIDLPPAEPADVAAESPFRALFVAGATGQRRTVELTHGSLLQRLERDSAHHGDTDRIGILNLYDYISLHTALRTLRAGATISILGQDNPPASIDVIGVTQLSIAADAARLLTEKIYLEPGRFPTLQAVELHSELPEPLLVNRIREAFGAAVVYRFGTIEHGVLTQASPTEVEKRPACAGRVVAGAEMRIVDEHRALLPHGTAGRIQVRLEDATCLHLRRQKSAGKHAWLFTGYYGRLDASNSLWILGKRKSLNLVEGEWINPGLIEQVLKMHADVHDAIVTVVPDRQGSGGKLVAGVDANELNAGELFRHCRHHLPGPVPASLISINGLPFPSRRQFLAHISRMAG